jgi:hypothetical protein
LLQESILQLDGHIAIIYTKCLKSTFGRYSENGAQYPVSLGCACFLISFDEHSRSPAVLQNPICQWRPYRAPKVLDAISTMNNFYIFGSLQFASVFVMGFPFSVAFMTREKAPHSSGWLLLAPAFGATFYFSAGTILHSFGLQAFAVFWTLIGTSTAASVAWLWVRRRSPLQIPVAAIWPCLLAAALALVLNSADLKFAGLDYFPLTNGDTFSYLGFIDQIRDTGWIAPRISYPAGYSPLIDHAVFTRAPSVIFSADFAEVLGLETHSAFFRRSASRCR